MRGFSNTGAALPGLSFMAFPGIGYGVRPSSIDIDGDGRDELLTAPGPGSGYWAMVKAFRYLGNGVELVPGGAFYAYTGPTCGARPAGGDGLLVVAPGPSPVQPARLRGFTYSSAAFSPLPGYDTIVFSGLGYGAVPVMVQLDGSGFDEAVIAPGPSPLYQAHIRAIRYDGSATQLLARPNFLAFDASHRYGAAVGSADLGF